jgi:hypothetical protein
MAGYTISDPAGAPQSGYTITDPPGPTPNAGIIGGMNPADVSGVENFLAGAGKAIADVGRGVAQLTSFNGRLPWGMTPEEYDAIKKQDAPLMATGAGVAGNVAGNLATMIGPGAALGAAGTAARLPGMVSAVGSAIAPRTALGALVQGIIMGGAQPVGTADSRVANAAIGGGISAALPTAVAGGTLVKSLIAPYTESGSNALTGRVLQRFATDPNAIANAPTQGLVPGSLPTLAEQTQDTGLATLEQALRSNPDAKGAIVGRDMANNAARVAAVQDIAGDPAQRAWYAAERSSVANDLYEKAFAENPSLTPWIKGQITQLQKRPAMQEAFAQASEMAANEGIELNPSNAVQVMHFAKMALDKMVEKAGGATGSATEQRQLIGIRDRLLMLMESKDFSPSYATARQTYAEMSKPINQMDVGQTLLDKLTPALADFGGNTRVNASSFAQGLRNADQTAKSATGFGGASLEDIMSPAQMSILQNVAKELAARANASDLGLTRGSATAQNLVSQDVLRQILGPLGLPQSWAESMIPQAIMSPLQMVAKLPEQRVMHNLATAVTDVPAAQRFVSAAQSPPGPIARTLGAAMPPMVTLSDLIGLELRRELSKQ